MGSRKSLTTFLCEPWSSAPLVTYLASFPVLKIAHILTLRISFWSRTLVTMDSLTPAAYYFIQSTSALRSDNNVFDEVGNGITNHGFYNNHLPQVHQKYKFMEDSLATRRKRLKTQVPDIRSSQGSLPGTRSACGWGPTSCWSTPWGGKNIRF